MIRTAITRGTHAIACGAVLLLSTSSGANAQDSIQTGDGLITLRASMPEQARVGEQFSYDVEVINASDNVMLHDIKLQQRKTKGFTIESISLKGDQGQDEDVNQSSESNSDSKSAENNKEDKKSSGSKDSMTIATLKPGDSRTFLVKASADKKGQLRSCLEIVSYTPAICLTSEIVKPELELTKTAPRTANRCNVIELAYQVKNAGTGDIGNFTITDSLGDGLATIEGDSELSFPVEGLKAGDTRKFVARVYAKRSGEFSSRAVAKASDSKLKSRSKETTTNVTAADLAASVTGPSRIYGDDLAQFTATITNTGNVAAEGVNVTVQWPATANMADMGEVTMVESGASNSNKKSQKNKGQNPTLASREDDENQDDDESSSDELQMQDKSFIVERLEAGQTAEFTYAIRTDSLNRLPTKVEARYTCTVDAAEDQAKSTAKATSIAMATVSIVRLPALQIAVIDDEDPVMDGTKVKYTIQVWNEGDALDEDVTLKATLPGNLTFDSADGPTDAKNEGKSIDFAPIKTFEAGDRVVYTVTAKPTGTGDARFRVALTSKMLQQEVIGEEPTRLFDSSSK